MAALGTGPFDTPDARTFLSELSQLTVTGRAGRLAAALDGVLLSQGPVDATTLSEGVSSAAVVGAALSPRAAAAERGVPGWVISEPVEADEELIEKSRLVLRRTLRRQDSDWWDLWREAELTSDVEAACRRAYSWLGDRDD